MHARSSVGRRQAIAHDGTYDVFVTLPAYTSTSEGEERQLGRGPKPCQGGPWREEMPSGILLVYPSRRE